MRGAGHGILDRLAMAFGYAANNQPTFAGINVHVKIDWSKYWFVQFLKRRREHLEDRGAWLGVLPGDNAQQCRALRLTCPFVDDDRRLPLTLVNRSRPLQYGDEPQPIEPRVAVATFVDLHADDGPAVAVGRQSIELAWTAVAAVAIHELARLDAPFHVRHGEPSRAPLQRSFDWYCYRGRHLLLRGVYNNFHGKFEGSKIGRISQYVIWPRFRALRDTRLLNVIWTENVKDRVAGGDQIIRNDPPVTAPPKSLGAHDCASLRVTSARNFRRPE
jgi:hypothetical protein